MEAGARGVEATRAATSIGLLYHEVVSRTGGPETVSDHARGATGLSKLLIPTSGIEIARGLTGWRDVVARQGAL